MKQEYDIDEREKRPRTTAQVLTQRGPVGQVMIDNFVSLDEYRQIVPRSAVDTDDE